MQNQWASILNPVIGNSIVNGLLLTGIPLKAGTTNVNHTLGRTLVGWIIVGSDGASEIYDKQAKNQTPNLTLQLVSSAAVTVSLWVF